MRFIMRKSRIALGRVASSSPAVIATASPCSANTAAAASSASTALVLIDLQDGIVALPLAPRSGHEPATAGSRLARRFREADAPVFLRRRGVRTSVIGGIATDMGVGSTARQAYEFGYEVVIAEDATTSLSGAMHGFSVGTILSMISRG